MRVEGIGSANTGIQMPVAQGTTDELSRSLQGQIQQKQQELQKLSENSEMSAEEKMKRRQEIQQEITNLNMQLRQHQIELRREAQSGNDSGKDAPEAGRRSAKDENGAVGGLSQAGMRALISADSSIKQSAVQGRVATEMDGRAGVLEAEIKQDSSRGVSTERKEAELAEVTERGEEATASQINLLGDADRVMKEAMEADEDDKQEKLEGQKETDQAEQRTQRETEQGTKNETEQATERELYTPVDVRI